MLLLLGAALGVALSFQAWRSLQLEADARQLELERAEALAERLLRQATVSRGVFEQVPEASRCTVRAGAVVVDGRAAWLAPAAVAGDDDVVVFYRLERASRAEFAAADAAAAQREFDELLAAPLPKTQRLQVVVAAAWQAQRAGAGERAAGLRRELEELAAALQPADLGRPAIVRAIGGAVRLGWPAGLPQWAARLVPFLPPEAVAGLTLPGELAAQNAAAVAARAQLAAVAEALDELRPSTPLGLLATSDRQLLWWLPREDGAADAALLRPEAWLAAVRAAGQAGALPEWPWQVEAEVAAASGQAFADVPLLAGLRPAPAFAVGRRPWVLPAVTLALLTAFGLAVAQQFRAARREAAAVRAQAEFLTTVTHELKTPLASIRLLGEMLLEGRAQGREADYYRMLAGEATRLSMLIENVLDLGRVERGERAYDLRPVDVGEVVRETAALLAPLAAGIAVHVPAGVPLQARLDRGALVQALVAVLDNARKYGGGPTEVAVAADGSSVRIGVRDHGPGVPEAERERIFERFVRGSSHRHGSTPGIGIGLYLARTIVRRLRGDLVCTAPLDGGPGTLFTFTLPMETAA